MKNKNPTLSLCMIVKNEERFLARCLASVKDYVDEIIVVDTGSTDKTAEIAKRYNAKVYYHKWQNHFSRARNLSLRYATCDWVLVMDADEEIEKKDVLKLKEVIKANDKDVLYVPVINRKSGGVKSESLIYTERLYRNHLGFHYTGPVHNLLNHNGKIKRENIRLYHYGYYLNKDVMEAKFKRSSVLLEEWIERDKLNPTPYYYLTALCLAFQMHDDAIKYAWKTLRLAEYHQAFVVLRVMSLYVLAVCFFNKKDFATSERYALMAITINPKYKDAYCILASTLYEKKEYVNFKIAAEKYLEIDIEKMGDIPCSTLGHRDKIIEQLDNI